MSEKLSIEFWKYECGRALKKIAEVPDEGAEQAEVVIYLSERLRTIAFGINGVMCERCGGRGRRVYGSTATWRGGCGGQEMTEDVCDGCWGTGRTDIKGADLRILRAVGARKVES